MLSLAARRFGDDWESARRWACRAYPQFFTGKADYGKFKPAYLEELGARAESLDSPDARMAVDAGDARALRSTRQYLLFDQTGVQDYAANWNAQPKQSPVAVPGLSERGEEVNVASSEVAAASAAGPVTRYEINPSKVQFVLDQLPKRGALWAWGYLDRVEGRNQWPGYIQQAITEQAAREGATA